MMHELHRLLPALVLEQHAGPVAVLLEIEAYFGADPFLRAIDDLPLHAAGRMKLAHLHVEAAAVAKTKFYGSAGVAVILRAVGPPGGKTFGRGQGLISVV